MSDDLIEYWDIDPDETDHGLVEAYDFLGELEWEGGILGLLEYGGAEVFPSRLRERARAVEIATIQLETEIRRWAAKRGVRY